jgi:hypothetical protein
MAGQACSSSGKRGYASTSEDGFTVLRKTIMGQ